MRTSQRTEAVAPSESAHDLWPARARRAKLHFVSGKGGVGKSTLSAALAIALASSGRRVLLVEVEGRQSIAHLFDVPPLPYAETKVASAANSGEVWALAIDVESAILEYFEMFYNLGFAAKAMRAVGAVDLITTIAPGLDDVVLTGKIYEIATRSQSSVKRSVLGKPPKSGTSRYDAIVVDSPPTGRVHNFLNAASALQGLAKGGPIFRHAENVSAVLRSQDTVVHLATILEALPVQETAEAVAAIKKIGVGVGAALVNRSTSQYLTQEQHEAAARGSVDADTLRKGLGAVGLDLAEDDFAGLITETIDHAVTQARQHEQGEALAELDLPQLPLPLLAGGVDLGALYELAEKLTQMGVR
ncbi:Anion-transporting ATPase [Segniliparus rotundus DSM 44985]|uniref:Anion-transporting ATPase n=1 Tax=Segniliparus rotundus (strain ATCC BAA-972 / CDC 1076 / CIP 108378 / DSM 44985 / JCM 13578) TaxID=640132 RepID=D6ZF57_SEGRD|nr:ArsA-related P-loop ATPase [Segniliparus rotundus]ADG97581.1 Anion-transporting ATPase [Segniliparus rotundus DSM 44985]